MKLQEFFGKRLPTNYIISTGSQIVWNHQYPGEMVKDEDRIEYSWSQHQLLLKDRDPQWIVENKDAVISILSESHEFDGVLCVRHKDQFEFRLFQKGKEETEFRRIFRQFTELVTKYRITREDLLYIDQTQECETIFNKLRMLNEKAIQRAEEKRKRKAKKYA